MSSGIMLDYFDGWIVKNFRRHFLTFKEKHTHEKAYLRQLTYALVISYKINIRPPPHFELYRALYPCISEGIAHYRSLCIME